VPQCRQTFVLQHRIVTLIARNRRFTVDLSGARPRHLKSEFLSIVTHHFPVRAHDGGWPTLATRDPPDVPLVLVVGEVPIRQLWVCRFCHEYQIAFNPLQLWCTNVLVSGSFVRDKEEDGCASRGDEDYIVVGYFVWGKHFLFQRPPCLSDIPRSIPPTRSHCEDVDSILGRNRSPILVIAYFMLPECRKRIRICHLIQLPRLRDQRMGYLVRPVHNEHIGSATARTFFGFLHCVDGTYPS